jgi:hypothetical protein
VVAGSAGLLGGNAWGLAVGSRPGWSSIPGLVLGACGIAAPLGGRSQPEQLAPVAAAGLLALVLDFLGVSGPPRGIPGAVLLAGAAVGFGSSRSAVRLPPLASVVAAAGLVAHALVGLILLSLGLVAPPWAVIALLAAWGRPARRGAPAASPTAAGRARPRSQRRPGVRAVVRGRCLPRLDAVTPRQSASAAGSVSRGWSTAP